jgi:D-serine dehydratase
MKDALVRDEDTMFRGMPLSDGSQSLPPDLVGRRVLDGAISAPIALLKRQALDHNASWMRHFVRQYGISIWPHGKTSMSPTIFRWQLNQGAEWLSLASATQAHVARGAGINRVLIANQVVNTFDLD